MVKFGTNQVIDINENSAVYDPRSVKELEKQGIDFNNMTEQERMAHVRQHMFRAMGMSKQYIHQADISQVASKISEGQMREVLT